MNYVYIHGFNSGAGSRSGALLEAMLGQPVLRVVNDYSQDYKTCLAATEAQISAQFPSPAQLCVMGTSLGGFYALQLRLPGIARVAAWNPVVFPALQLAAFVGENTRFTDGKKWHFSRQALLSYAAAADARQWSNFQLAARYGDSQPPPCPLRHVYIGSHDEVLDHEIGVSFWHGHAGLTVIDSGHSIADFSHAAPFLIP